MSDFENEIPVTEEAADPVADQPQTDFETKSAEAVPTEDDSGATDTIKTEDQESAPAEPQAPAGDLPQPDSEAESAKAVSIENNFDVTDPFEIESQESNSAESEASVSDQSESSSPADEDDVFFTQMTETVAVQQAKSKNLFLRILCWILVILLVFSGGVAAGYAFWGHAAASKNVADMSAKNDLYGSADIALDSKPKKTDELTAAQVYAKVNPSVVGIRVYNENGDGSDASGVIYTKDGYVVTNDHIYMSIGAPHFRIYMYDGTEYDADYVAGDVVSDLAVLKIRDGKNLKPAVFGNSEEIVCGENTVAIGRPSDATSASTVTKGIISMTARRVQTTSSYSARLIQTDTAINSGSSGGALVNMYGQVIGITANKMSTENGFEGMGYAIPTKTVKRIVEQLIANGKVTDRAKLGISYYAIDSVTAAVGKYHSVGLYVSTVSEDSELHGKVKEGDIITHVNGKEITDDDIILDIIEDSKAGDTITVTVLSGKTAKDYKVKLKANVSESSYSDVLSDLPTEKDDKTEEKGNNGGTFNFPDGE